MGIRDKRAMAVMPGLKLKLFLDLQYAGMSRYMLHWRPRGALAFEVQIAYSVEILYPNIKEITTSTRKLSISQQAQIRKNLSKKSLRQPAREYGVSREAIRRTIDQQSA